MRKAEALKDSTDWKVTADELTKLQKEWKTIGPVAKKYSDAVWKRSSPLVTTSSNKEQSHFFTAQRRAGKSGKEKKHHRETECY